MSLNAVEELKKRHNTARPRGRDVRKMKKPWTCREVLFTCSNGWTIEKLVPADYALEGFFMGHCLGGIHGRGCDAVASLREPDGTPHVTFTFMGAGAHGRCNAFPVKYVHLVNEWRESLGQTPYDEAKVKAILASPSGWGADEDDQYHEQGVLTDKDYRDLPNGRWWRDQAWKQKRGKDGK